MVKRLSEKQEKFIRFYIETGNGTLSVLNAGYDTDRSTAAVIASENLRKPNIIARLGELRKEIYGPRIMSQIERLARLSDIARENNPGQRGYQRQPNIQAIDTLNKMENIYSDSAIVNVDNRKIEIYVNSSKARELTERITQGENTDNESL